MKTKTLHVITDPGHAWVKVHRNDKFFKKIADKISCFSYELGDYVYLEEDDDLATYINVLKKEGYSYIFKEISHCRENYSRIRNYDCYEYRPDYVPSSKKTEEKRIEYCVVYFISKDKYVLRTAKNFRGAQRVCKNLQEKFYTERRKHTETPHLYSFAYHIQSYKKEHLYNIDISEEARKSLHDEIMKLKENI